MLSVLLLPVPQDTHQAGPGAPGSVAVVNLQLSTFTSVVP
jgi:hypothetical protein